MTYSNRDTCYGTVWCRNSRGVYLRLDGGETAFAYGFLGLKNGSRVCCSVRRQANGFKSMEVTIDSTVFADAS